MRTKVHSKLVFIRGVCAFFLLGVAGASFPAAAQITDSRVRSGTQWVTTIALLDQLAAAKAVSPYLPAKRPIFDRMSPKMKGGLTVQNPWGGDGENKHLHVRVRKVWSKLVQYDLRDCLVIPKPGFVAFDVDVLPNSILKFAPEVYRFGGSVKTELRVVVVDGGTRQTLYSQVLRASNMWGDKWDEESLSLARFAGRKVSLRFEVGALDAASGKRKRGKPGAVGLFAMPRILTGLRTSDTALRARVKQQIGDEMNQNIIMIVFDSMRADLVSPVREERRLIPSVTPNLDRFMSKGVRFSRAFSVGNQTRTGSYSMYLSTPPAAGGFWQIKWFLRPDFRRRFYNAKPESLPRTLHRYGYLTGHLGYNSFLHANWYLALDMGFDFVSEFNGVPKNTVNMTKGIQQWLKEHKDEKFFLLIWYDPPHFPYVAPPGYKKRVLEAGVPKKHKFFANGYLAKMMYGDDYFGKLMSTFEELGLMEKTLFVLTADHGEAMDVRHNGYSNNVKTRVYRHHGKSLYDEEIHVPLMFRQDGVLGHGVDVADPVSLVSLAPTVQELLGLPTNFKKQFGRSFATLVRGGTEAEKRTIYFEARWSYGIRKDGYKYIFHDKRERLRLNSKRLFQRGRDGHDELFDSNSDPFELTSLAPTHKDILKRMRKAYFDYRKKLRQFRTTIMKGRLSRPIVDLGMKP